MVCRGYALTCRSCIVVCCIYVIVCGGDAAVCRCCVVICRSLVYIKACLSCSHFISPIDTTAIISILLPLSQLKNNINKGDDLFGDHEILWILAHRDSPSRYESLLFNGTFGTLCTIYSDLEF